MGTLEFRGSRRGTRLYDGSRALTAPDPEESARRRLQAVGKTHSALYLLFSPVFPFGIDEFLRDLPEGTRVAAIEAEREAFFSDTAAWNELARDSAVTILAGLPVEEARHALEKTIETSRVRSVRPVWMTGAARRNRHYYEALLTAAEEKLALVWQNRATIISFGRLWIRNLFLNLKELAFSIDHLDSLAQKPIFLAGAGPSLEALSSFILKQRSRVSLIAVDTALPFLLHIGAVPDAVVSVDAQHLNVKDLLPPPPENVKLLYDATAAPAFVRKFRRTNRFAFFSEFADTALWELLKEARVPVPRIEAGGSVGTTALLLADRLRRRAGSPALPILLGGVDFAFPPGQPHARMTYTHILTLTQISRLQPLPFLAAHLRRKRLHTAAKGGGRVATDYVLAGYGAQLRSAASRFPTVFDMSSSGVDLGLPVIGESEAEEILSEQRAEPRPVTADESGTAPGPSPVDPFLIRRFLTQEEAALREIASAIRERTESEEAILHRLRRRDYVYYYFPDPEPKLEESYLRRIIASISYLLRSINKPVA
ncbi:MAG: 6-hydroxymethylpterin diphosphokinase MptE-like protein [Spirochaetaceae bacterium]